MRSLLLAGAFSILSSHALAANNWFSFKDPDSAFTVDLPGTPTVSHDSTTAGDGTKLPTLSYEVDQDPVSLTIWVGDFRSVKADAGRAIDGGVAALRDGAAKIVVDQIISLDGQIGHEIATVDKDGNTDDDSLFFVDSHCYQVLTVVGKNATADQLQVAKRFRDSFHFVAK
jgi:hypothetical protein